MTGRLFSRRRNCSCVLISPATPQSCGWAASALRISSITGISGKWDWEDSASPKKLTLKISRCIPPTASCWM